MQERMTKFDPTSDVGNNRNEADIHQTKLRKTDDQNYWRHDTQHNDPQHNDTEHNDIQNNNAQHNDIQQNNE
jgi:hypothetical protein